MKINKLCNVLLVFVGLVLADDIKGKNQKEPETNLDISVLGKVLPDGLFVKPSNEWKIFPGTKWCGQGTLATKWDDLGRHKETDMCCRQHDACPWILRVEQSRWGLKNNDTFTRSHCSCDWKFHYCLKKVGGFVSFLVRGVYFKYLQPKCFHQELPEPPAETCLYKGKSLQHKSNCLFYEMDTLPNVDIPMRWREIWGKHKILAKSS